MREYNPFVYSLFKSAKFSEAVACGYKLHISDDGNWGLGDIENGAICEHYSSSFPDFAPQDAKDYYDTNKHLDHKNALLLKRCDGWKGL